MPDNLKFANPEFFWLLLLLPLYLGYYIWKYNRQFASLTLSDTSGVSGVGASIRVWIRELPLVLRLVGICLLIVALARPQSVSSKQKVSTEGIDIVLAVDISSSMLAEDFRPNRLEAAKRVAGDFVAGRPNDRIGMVVFAGESFTQIPLTTDHNIVQGSLREIESGLVEDGTAIGMGLATAVDRLKDSDAKSKVVILLTDGSNNQGSIDPKTAADVAKTLGIRVYTIGVGTKGRARYPFVDQFGRKHYQDVEVDIDEELLTYIAQLTGVDYFRATDDAKLKSIFAAIDELEKTRIEVASFQRYSEEFLPFALWGLALVIVEMALRYTFLRQLP